MINPLSIKVTQQHLARIAYVYVRQSTMTQVMNHLESQQRQYELVEKAQSFGWSSSQTRVIDHDLGQSGADSSGREGFRRLVAEVGMGGVGIIFGLEVSRLARNNADWYQLLDLCALFGTLIADAEGIYDPSQYNDRLLLGLKGTMSEAELHLMRNRMQGGLLHKAKKGELKMWLPAGYEYNLEDRIVKSRDELMVAAIQWVFHQFDVLGSARRVMTYLHAEDILIPVAHPGRGVEWKKPSYRTIYHILTNPVYAGAYVYGKVKYGKVLGPDGKMVTKSQKVSPEKWHVFMKDHHEGYITWEEYEANQQKLRNNCKGLNRHGSPQKGAALLQGLLLCGKCGRRMRVAYSGSKGNVQRYACQQAQRMQGGEICQTLGGKRLEQTVVSLFLETITPASMKALTLALEKVEATLDAKKSLLEKQLEKAQYEADRARRQYDQVEPENRLVARTMEKAWEERLQEVDRMEQRIQAKENLPSSPLTAKEKQRIQSMGSHIQKIWEAETTTYQDQKALLRILISDVIVVVDRENHLARCTLVWEGGVTTPFTSPLNQTGKHHHVTEEEIVQLVRQLALHYPDEMIARILIRQRKKTGKGNSFTAGRVCSLRNYHGIPVYPGEPILERKRSTVAEVASELKVSTATVLRWLRDGFIKGHQITPGAPWEIEITDDLRKRIVPETSPAWVPLKEAAILLNCTKQTVLNRMKNEKLEAIYVQQGKRKGLRFRVPISTGNQESLFDGEG